MVYGTSSSMLCIYVYTAEIAKCIQEAIPFANVSGVMTESELENSLGEDRINMPINEEVEIDIQGNDRNAKFEISGGCFVYGAGMFSCVFYLRTYMYACTRTLYM